MDKLFSYREGIKDVIRDKDKLTVKVYNELLNIIKRNKFSLSQSYPETCNDYKYSNEIVGVSFSQFMNSLEAHIPSFDFFPKEEYENIGKETYLILDALEFIYPKIMDYKKEFHHQFYNHHHLIFVETKENKENFRKEINTLFERNGIIYNLEEDGKIKRVLPKEFENLIKNFRYVDDEECNKLLNEAFENFSKPKRENKIIALEKIWGAFERIKTYYIPEGLDKRNSIEKILNDITSNEKSNYTILNEEGIKLSDIGNNYQIRHKERNKNPICDEIVDYLFYRMVSFLNLLFNHLSK